MSRKHIFNFLNGDVYIGEFNISANAFHRHGYGVYIKKRNGTVYKGEWKNGVLVNADEIVFEDKSKFVNGQLSETHQFEKGSFVIPHVGHLYPSSFEDNNPAGPIEMIDCGGFKWQGHCELNDAFLTPVNNDP